MYILNRIHANKYIVAAILLLVVMAASMAASLELASAQTNAAKEVCEGLGGTSNCSNPAGQPTANSILEVALNALSVVAGFASVIMVIVTGLKYITSQGDASSVSSAKNSIIYIAVGITIIALSQMIVYFVLDNAP